MSQSTEPPQQSDSQQSAPQQSCRRPSHPRQGEPRPLRRDVSDLFSGGRLVAIPRKAARREQLLVHLAQTLFPADRTYTEPEVNEALRAVHEDCSALRRYLITSGLLTRTRDGRSCRRSTTTL